MVNEVPIKITFECRVCRLKLNN